MMFVLCPDPPEQQSGDDKFSGISVLLFDDSPFEPFVLMTALLDRSRSE